MKVMQVFDCTDMPDKVRQQFYDWASNGNSVGNDCYVDFWIDDYQGEEVDEYSPKLVVEWLKQNGATDSHVLIKHWW